MASFTEQATLKVIDQSTSQFNKSENTFTHGTATVQGDHQDVDGWA